MEHLQDRLSKWQVMALSRELHHDEAGIGKMCDLMLYAEDAQSAYNAAWILYYLSAEDKRLYVSPFYDKIADSGNEALFAYTSGTCSIYFDRVVYEAELQDRLV